jgi:hypothetical protein
MREVTVNLRKRWDSGGQRKVGLRAYECAPMPQFLFGSGDISLAADACRCMRSMLHGKPAQNAGSVAVVNQPRRNAKSLYNAESV